MSHCLDLQHSFLTMKLLSCIKSRVSRAHKTHRNRLSSCTRSSASCPNDISYVFSGYAPLSIRLIQHAIRSGWRPIEEILKLLPGPHSEIKRSGFATSTSFDSLPGVAHNTNKVGDGRRSLVLVVFIGGVTFAEISALRFLSAQEGMAYDVVVATTSIVNGNSLTETFVQKLG